MKFLTLLACLILSACGGGGPGAAPAPPVVVAFLGDSLTRGTHSASPTEWLPIVWSPTPTQYITDQTGIKAIDYSRDGAQSIAAVLVADAASVVVLAFGVADAATGVTPAQTGAALRVLASRARSLGQYVVIVGVIAVPDVDTTEHDAQARAAADATGSVFADVRTIPAAMTPAFFADSLHPSQAYSQAIGRVIAAAIKGTHG